MGQGNADLRLQYRELKLGENQTGDQGELWYTVAHWQAGSAQFDYWSQGSWHDRFSGRPQHNQADTLVLPQLIRLRVEAGPRSMELWLALASAPSSYQSPGDGSGLF